MYGATKLAQEHLLGAWAGSHDVPLSVLRLQNVYGPGQSLSNPYTGIVSLFSQLARDGRSIPLYEDGEITRDFVYIDDVASASWPRRRPPPTTPVRTVDVGTGVRTTIRDLARRSSRSTTGRPRRTSPVSSATGTCATPRATCNAPSTSSTGSRGGPWPTGVAALQEWIECQLVAR